MSFMTCCVSDCLVKCGEGETLHCFPDPNIDYKRFEIWSSNIGGEVVTLDATYVFKNRRICHKHFEKKFYGSGNRLIKNAVPTLYLSGAHSQIEEARGLTAFIDVGDGGTFNGLLDQFAQELQNSDDKDRSKGIDEVPEDKNDGNKEVKKETQSQDDEPNKLFEINNDRFTCLECRRYTAESEEKIMQHIRRVHRGENPFLCYMCDYSAYNKTVFEEHIRVHQGIKPFKCSFCSYKCVSKNNLKKHEQIHRPNNPLKCTECDYVARHKRGLACHIKKSHTSVDGDSVSCTQCNKNFPSHTLLVLHLSKEIKCDSCQFTTCSKSLMATHKENEHNYREMKKKIKKKDIFKCSICEWSSSNKPRILLHLIHHPNQSVNEDIIDISILKEHGIMT